MGNREFNILVGGFCIVPGVLLSPAGSCDMSCVGRSGPTRAVDGTADREYESWTTLDTSVRDALWPRKYFRGIRV